MPTNVKNADKVFRRFSAIYGVVTKSKREVFNIIMISNLERRHLSIFLRIISAFHGKSRYMDNLMNLIFGTTFARDYLLKWKKLYIFHLITLLIQ